MKRGYREEQHLSKFREEIVEVQHYILSHYRFSLKKLILNKYFYTRATQLISWNVKTRRGIYLFNLVFPHWPFLCLFQVCVLIAYVLFNRFFFSFSTLYISEACSNVFDWEPWDGYKGGIKMNITKSLQGFTGGISFPPPPIISSFLFLKHLRASFFFLLPSLFFYTAANLHLSPPIFSFPPLHPSSLCQESYGPVTWYWAGPLTW